MRIRFHSKTNAAIVGFAELRRIREAVPRPIVAIGGIQKKTAPEFIGTGINGLAVVSAIATRELRRLFMNR